MREYIDQYQNFDPLCFNVCNLKLEHLLHGINDIILEGFHEQILKEPFRACKKGGELVIYINICICEENDIDPFDPNPKPKNNCGESQFKNAIGNVYRSPSRNP